LLYWYKSTNTDSTASQLEFLNDFDAALLMYSEAAKVAAKVWGETHGKTLKMHADCQV
jgi:hypothetical protein